MRGTMIARAGNFLQLGGVFAVNSLENYDDLSERTKYQSEEQRGRSKTLKC